MSTQSIAMQKQITNIGFMDFSNLENALKSAEIIANSSVCPTSYKGKSGDVLVAIQLGLEIGLKPMQSIQNIAVINGRPCVWGDAALALCLGNPAFEYCHEYFDDKTQTAVCTVKRKGMQEITKNFSIEDAKKAGLWGKQGPWTTYPKRMMQMRARGFALRDMGADWLKGIILREEAQDYPVERIEKEVNQGIEIKNVADSLKAKLKNKNNFTEIGATVKMVEIIEPERDQDSPTAVIETKSLEPSVQKIETAEPPMDSQTEENLFVLYESCEEFQKRIDGWLSKKDIIGLKNLTEKQAQKIINQLEKENPKAREYWEDYLFRKEISELEGSDV